jgi:hypothetical protein
MKVLSLTQPWATAVALGLKRWETRSWPTSFRGEVAIHAAKAFPKWAKEFAAETMKGSNLKHLSMGVPLGKIVCVCYLSACCKTRSLVLSEAISEQEQAWGDYAEGRFAFELRDVRELRVPVPAKGALGFWNVSPELEAAIRAQL